MKHRRWPGTLLIAGITFSVNQLFAGLNDNQFESPICIKAGDKILNADGAMLYPSPAIFDVDQDGNDELVIGTIFGKIFACENSNASSVGDPVWGNPKALKTKDGKELKLNNW